MQGWWWWCVFLVVGQDLLSPIKITVSSDISNHVCLRHKHFPVHKMSFHPFLIHCDLPLTTQHPGLLPARLRSPGSGDGDPGAPETSSSSQCWGGGRWPGGSLQRAWPVHPQLDREDGPLQPPRSGYGQDSGGGQRRQPPAQGQRPVSDSTHYPGRGGAGKKRFYLMQCFFFSKCDQEMLKEGFVK